MLLKMQLVLNVWVNEERHEMKQLVILKVQLMLNIPFLTGVPNNVAIPIIQAEWLANTNNLIHGQSPLMISWAYTIHKSQGKTSYLAIIDLGNSEKCSGVKLVALSHVYYLIHLLLHQAGIPLTDLEHNID